MIPGNHNTLLESAKWRKSIRNAHLLIDSGVELEGFRIWGSPITSYTNVAFGIADSASRVKHWSKISSGLDILVTHCPPFKVLDCGTEDADHGGCPNLRAAVILKRSRLHVFGHVHSAYGMRPTVNPLFVNAALAGEFGDLDKAPISLVMASRARSKDPSGDLASAPEAPQQSG